MVVPTPIAILFPWIVIDPNATEGLDLLSWSDYEWREDYCNGLVDLTKPVERTVGDGRGDCEDYAFVAASWSVNNGSDNVHIAWCSNFPEFHVIAYDEKRVYSSGNVTEESPSKWESRSEYKIRIDRKVK